jgi:hypothetical protein
MYRARSDRPGTPVAARVVFPDTPETRPQLEDSDNWAIDTVCNELHLHFRGMSAAGVAEAIRQADERR